MSWYRWKECFDIYFLLFVCMCSFIIVIIIIYYFLWSLVRLCLFFICMFIYLYVSRQSLTLFFFFFSPSYYFQRANIFISSHISCHPISSPILSSPLVSFPRLLHLASLPTPTVSSRGSPVYKARFIRIPGEER